jgi:hypothetical protein
VLVNAIRRWVLELRVDARKLSDLLRAGLLTPLHHGETACARCANSAAIESR